MEAVLVSHPHAAAFANGVAAAFERRSKLALYVSGVVASRATLSGQLMNQFAAATPVVRNRIIAGVRPKRVRSLAPVELAARLVARAFGSTNRPRSLYDAMFVSHDTAVELLEWPRRTDMVYAYEDAALRTFVRAARRGLARVWDLPLPHYQTLEKMWIAEMARWPGAHGSDPPTPIEPDWKKRRKDAELGLATAVSVASAHTRASLEDLGVKIPVVVTPYGFPVEAFQPKTAMNDGPFTVLAVGTQDLRKGTPYLLEAWKKAGLKNAHLRLIGRLNLSSSFLDRYAGLFEHVPYEANAGLGAIYRAADLLMFPTLGDGYGLVIQEAMSCATPVVTTPCGGGPESIRHGETGWIVPPRDIDALVEHLRFAAANRDKIFAVGQAARARAEQWTWRQAGEALVRALSQL
ncbi:MAG TPA: glycosyltransferase family 4 protein [Polyangia bacterium]|jgi:glycosyltransferase involved in cell wall biosynthesis|nr:glycosyltransferase family 4 protein [Polyangia bacterium]